MGWPAACYQGHPTSNFGKYLFERKVRWNFRIFGDFRFSISEPFSGTDFLDISHFLIDFQDISLRFETALKRARIFAKKAWTLRRTDVTSPTWGPPPPCKQAIRFLQETYLFRLSPVRNLRCQHWEPHVMKGTEVPTNKCIVGFHMTSLKFKLKSCRSYRDFTLTMHWSSWKLIFIQMFLPQMKFLVL